ncbi:MAG: DUF3575 domain-containing protein [Bacteroidia bacterium]|nr:DUF3575 domain-containing protein [Bacteroidia bacterium]
MKHLKRKLCLTIGVWFFSFGVWAQEPAARTRTEVEQAWYIYFKAGKSDLEQENNGNANSIQHFVNRFHEIIEKNEFTINQVRIIGYASPEGSIELNRRLSAERAEVLKHYLSIITGLPKDIFITVAGGENWNELCIMVENSELEQKQQILDIIRNAPQDVDPEQELKRLPNNTYRHLLNNFYPKLRSASSVQILREIPVETTPPVIDKVVEIKDTIAVIDTTRLVPQKHIVPESEPCHCFPPVIGIKTNLAYWAAFIIPNLEIETYFSQRFSFSAEGVYRWLKDSKAKGNTYNIAYVSPEFRMYVRDDASFEGSYWGIYGQYGEYDIKMGSTGRQGNYRGLGISYGYIFKFNRFDCLYFDLGISAGYGRMKYDSYYWYDPCNAFESHTGKNYWGPTKLKASLIWRF